MSNSGGMQLDSSLQWLPPGWMVEVKERPCGKRRDKVYIDPVSGHKFWSRLEILRYLGILESKTPRKRDRCNVSRVVPITTGTSMSNANRIVQDGTLDKSFDWLPLNWQVEFKETKNHRVDKYYIHPVWGYKFRSKQEVSRYLQNGEMPKDSHKRRRVDDAELTGRKCLVSLNSFSAAKIPKQARSGTKRGILTGQSSDTSKVENNERVLTLSDVYASDRSWKGFECYRELPCAEKDYILALSAVSPQMQHAQIRIGKSSNEKLKPSPQRTDNERAYLLPCRTSRRLAGLEPELLPTMGEGRQIVLIEPTAEVDTERDMQSLGGEEQPNELGKSHEDGVAAADYTMKLALEEPKSTVTLSRDDGGTKKDVHSVGCEEQPNEHGKTSEEGDAPEDNPTKLASGGPESNEKNTHTLGSIEQPNELGKTSLRNVPADCSGKLACKKARSKITKHTVKVGNRKDEHSIGTKKQPNESRKISEDKDAPADYAKKIAFSGPQSGFTVPFGEPLLDPCYAFAYKTLTGLIPLENLPVKGFFCQDVTSVSTQNTGCLKWQKLHGMDLN